MNHESKIIVVSGSVIIENGKVLLDKHGDDGFWKFLGGGVKNFDLDNPIMSLETACAREAKEESGIDIEIICPLKPMMVPRPESESIQVVLIHYLAKRIGDIKLGKDIDDFREFEVKKILNNGYPDENFAPNILPVLKSYLELKERGIITV